VSRLPILPAALLLATALALAGCGKKPRDVIAPEGAVQRTYPNPAHDPKPGENTAPRVKFP
jgi:predicted small lipoprotein YifL